MDDQCHVKLAEHERRHNQQFTAQRSFGLEAARLS